ncbi:MAG: hypothetical protein ABI886_07980 [Betaproteobacteria bacterium]
MPPRSLARIPRLAAAILVASVSLAAHAQGTAPDTVSGSAAVTGFTMFNANLDAGGRTNWAGGIASGTLTRQFTPQLSAGLVVRYDYQSWNFNAPTGFGGGAPWKNLNAPLIALAIGYAYAPDLLITIRPTVEWAYESGAATGDAMTYGAVASVAKVFSPDLVLGLGVSAFRRIDKTQALPFLIVNWKFADKWRLSNPFQAGPTGGAGLELVYTPDDRWEFGQGISYRSYRFRLKQDGPTPGGVGENSFIPLFARFSRTFSKDLRLDFWAALVDGGSLSVDYANGGGRYQDDYKVAPGLGATLAWRF